MFVLEGIKSEENIEPTIEGLISFIDREMTEEKKEDFYTRKYITKGSKRLFRIGFDSLFPLKLSLQDDRQWEDISSELKMSKNYFHPLFLSNNITNGQYKKLTGEGTTYLNNYNNAGSFSDYFISRKVFELIYKGIQKNGGDFKLEVGVQIKEGSVKSEILLAFYELVHNISFVEYENDEFEGMEFFIDFNTILENDEIIKQDKESFLNRYISELGIEMEINMGQIADGKQLNGLFYFLESILFQAETIFGLELEKMEEKTIPYLLEEKVNLNFEVPTNEKPLLSNPRNKILGKDAEIPKISLLEAILLRFLVVVINKQGTTPLSGFRFPIKENGNTPNSIEKMLQVVSDKNGNLSILNVSFIDVKKEEKFKQSILDNRERYLGIDSTKQEDDSVKRFFQTELFKVLKNFSVRFPKEEKVIWNFYHKQDYRAAGKRLMDGPFNNLPNRVLRKLQTDDDYMGFLQLKTLLFVIDTLRGSNQNEGKLSYFMSSKLIMEEMMEKEELSKEEAYYMLGKIAGLVVRSSRNKDSLVKTVLKKSRPKDVLEVVNKRFESGFEEIEYKGLLKNWMTKLIENGTILDQTKTMSPDEKFTFITGLLSEVRTQKKTVSQGGNENGI